MSIKCKFGFHSYTKWELHEVRYKLSTMFVQDHGRYMSKAYIYKRECTVCGIEKFKKTEV